ncbi:MAG: phage tail tape measure protein, partial [Chloroflexota bacterium]|nr:phage tail tape measure protein [Chloroflexota bacterium]
MPSENFLLNFLLRAQDETGGVMSGFSGNVGKVGHEAQIAFGAIGLAAGAAVIAAVHMAESFDAPMRKIYSLTGINEEQFKSLKQQVLDLSTIVPKSAEDLANGLYFVVSAGFKGSDAMKILEVSAKAASAGLTDTKTVADAVTSALNAYKLGSDDAAHVTDLLTNAVTQGKTEYGPLADAIGRVLPAAAAMGVGLDEVLASMSTMTRVGLNADEAATALRGTLLALVKPGADAQAALAKMGLSAAGLRDELKTKGLMAVLQELMEKTGGNVEVIGKIIPNVRALTGVLATAGSQAEAYSGILGSMQNVNGLTEESFRRTAEGAGVQMGLLKNNLVAIAITIGDVLLPPLAELTGHIAGVVRGISEWMKANPMIADFAAKGLALVAVFGTLLGGGAALGAMFSFLVGPLIGAGGALGGVATALGGVSGGMLAILGPIALIVAAVIALKLAWDANLGGIQDKVAAAMPAISAAIDTVRATLAAWQAKALEVVTAI